MSNRLPILVALVAGVLAAMLTSSYVEDIRVASTPAITAVMVSTRDLKPGTVLAAEDVTEARRYAEGLPKFAVKWNERAVFIGQPLRFAVSEGDFVLASYFGAEVATADRLSEKVDAAQNQRAVTIPVSSETSLEGSIRPGDRVDLLLTYQGGAGAASVVTMPLIERAYVVATGAYGSRPSDPYSAITLLVGAEEAKLLVWARNLGEVSVLLRNPKDLAASDRAFLAGDAQALKALGAKELSVGDAVRSAAPIRE